MLGIFVIYLLSIIFRAKNVAKVQQIFQLCKFFTTNFSIVQIFCQENLSTIFKSYPKQNRKSLIYSLLQFLQC